MRVVLAMLRSSFLVASSYRLQFLFSLGALLITVVPLFFVTTALQPTMASVIAGQGSSFFAFTLLGVLCITLIVTALRAPTDVIGAGIATGTLELFLASPTPTWLVLAGLVTYDVLQSLLRALLLAVSGAVLGMSIVWPSFVPGLLALVLTVAAYAGIGLFAAAMTVAFRTTGPFFSAVLSGSSLLGGVYFPTTVIPSWVARLSDVIPLTYGLRALRRLWLDGASVAEVRGDLMMLTAMTTLLCVGGALTLRLALRDARHRGTLGQY